MTIEEEEMLVLLRYSWKQVVMMLKDVLTMLNNVLRFPFANLFRTRNVKFDTVVTFKTYVFPQNNLKKSLKLLHIGCIFISLQTTTLKAVRGGGVAGVTKKVIKLRFFAILMRSET